MKSINRVVGWTGIMIVIFLFLWSLANWHWKPGAVVLAFVLLSGGAAILYRIVTRKLWNNMVYRIAVLLALGAVLLLAWINVAVGGILGDDPANMMYFGVVLVALVGSAVAGLQPFGMSKALIASGLAMVLVPAIALILATPAFANGVVAVFSLHGFFAVLFISSAWLFKKAAT